RAAGFFHRGDGRFRGAVDRERHLGLDFTRAKKPHAGLGAAQDTRFDQGRGVDLAGRVERAGIDCFLDAAEIDLIELDREHRVLEAALRQAAVQRHLTALKPFDAHAGARGLALAAAAAGLALAGTDAAADALARLARA